MYCNEVYYCKYKGLVVICLSNKGKEPEDGQLCKSSNIYHIYPQKIKDTSDKSKYTQHCFT